VNYSGRLKDPRWQRKRLEILERDCWSCQECGDTKKTLNVHHLKYERRKSPWDIESKFLVTLCDVCHEAETVSCREELDALVSLLKEHAFTGTEYSDVVTALYEILKCGGKEKLIDILESAEMDIIQENIKAKQG
jgi:hypothetical protein